MEHEHITEKIIGCAFRVFQELGFGFLESVYEKSLAIECADAGLSIQFQHPIQVFYRGQIVGTFVADAVAEDAVIVELKSVSQLTKAHEVQLVNYLVATQKPVGLLINFGPEGVQIKRKVRTLRKKSRQD